MDKISRKWLSADEIEALGGALGVGRHALRDGTLLLVSYRHGLRVSEALGLLAEQIDQSAGLLHVQRLKNGIDTPLRGDACVRVPLSVCGHWPRDWRATQSPSQRGPR